MPKATILIAEDEKSARLSLKELLEGEDYRVLTAENGEDALALMREFKPEVALLDIRMPRVDGLTVLRTLREQGLGTAILVVTAYGTSDSAIEAMKLGAFDYLTKPLDFNEVLALIERALDHRVLAKELEDGRARSEEAPLFGSIVGQSPQMQRVFKLIGQVAASDATVLIRGESGTGKELVVNAIHEHSGRVKGPLVKINSAAIPETLLESELFGHERGAFTNAMNRRIGRFEQAGGGTLFLDEIGELPLMLQAKLLRALQERVIERLGGNNSVQIDIRLVAATARDLEKELSEGRFREDLYYRLNVVSIVLPPLRDRKQDIPALVQHFLCRDGQKASIASDALSMLCAYEWPGNVRELENVISRAIVLAHNGVITAGQIGLISTPVSLQSSWTDVLPLDDGYHAVLKECEKALVRRAMLAAAGSKTKAAEILKIHRRLLYDKMREHGLN
jgi:two-component system response regulator AtoC